MPNLCPKCGCDLDTYRKHYEQSDILLQTPQSVWQMYKANGYTLEQAIREELSYA
jgi:hypothetical protein